MDSIGECKHFFIKRVEGQQQMLIDLIPADFKITFLCLIFYVLGCKV